MAKHLHSSTTDHSCNDTQLQTPKRMRIEEKKSVGRDPAAGSWDGIDFGDKDDDTFEKGHDTTENWGEDTEGAFTRDDHAGASTSSCSTKNSNHNNTTTKYTECWICTNCSAMNRLRDTLSLHNLCCAACHRATYLPG